MNTHTKPQRRADDADASAPARVAALVARARAAQRTAEGYDQARVDELVADLEHQAAELAESLAQLSARLHRDRAAMRA
jgi:hypothetical protein